ncbi:MAG: sulfide/dihydroorotate dehydrogenase-like FAD/NAD-binding protein [Fervidobacterium sp.]
MNLIISKKKLAHKIHEFWIDNPYIASHAKPGQFVIVRINEYGERIPLTIAEVKDSAFRIVVKAIGKSTYELCSLSEGYSLYDVAGPLGKPSEIKFYGNVLIIGGGVGIAAILPIAKALKEKQNYVTVIIGAKTKDELILSNEFSFADKVIKVTDDGSEGIKGTVTDVMEKELRMGYQITWAVGPAIMMKLASEVAKRNNLLIWVSLNSIMIDGTGMCGGCRTVLKKEKSLDEKGDEGEIKYVCVDGPEFDGRFVDWDSFMKRLNQYKNEERIALERYLSQVGEPSWL